MKCLILGCCGLLLVLSVRAQTFNEWFRQNSTRLKYYGKQIAALQVYLGELGKGYAIVDGGLGSIGNSEQGELQVHTDHYASLGRIDAAVGRLQEMAEIAGLQTAIVQRFTEALARYRRNGFLGDDQIAYVERVYGSVLQASVYDVQMLMEVLTAGHWQMTDDQRMDKIRKIGKAMRKRYSFTLAFLNGTDLFERQLALEWDGVEMVRTFFGNSK